MTTTRFPTLGRWYATPLSREEAERLHGRLEEREAARVRRARGCFICRLGVLVARFWLDEPVEESYQSLAALARRRRTHRAGALLELVYGQLLAARRLPGAMLHLERGFAEGRNLLAPGDYFTVLKRNALLRQLPPTHDSAAHELQELLTTARVIERFTGGRTRGISGSDQPPETF